MDQTTFQTYRDHALRVATKAHDGQFRADKKTPYIAHSVEVARRTVENLREKLYHMRAAEPSWGEVLEQILLAGELAALVHDTREDKPDFPLEAELSTVIPSHTLAFILEVVGHLTNTGDDYLTYVLRISALKNQAPWQVPSVVLAIKEEDINVNIDELKHHPSEGARKGLMNKYALAHWILFGRRPYATMPFRPEYSLPA